jgi:hypothetical protein
MKARPYSRGPRPPHICLESYGIKCGYCESVALWKALAPAPKPPKVKLPKRPKPKKSPALIRYHASKRRAARLNRTPPWADLDAIRAFYDEAERLTLATGIKHHVDHIIPMQGERVSGLHVETNLQVIAGTENIRKHNRFDPC